MDSRKQFVKEVASTIRENHSRGEDSFIFGISGKWGEGKTFFLNQLSVELGEFEIVSLNPWKYANDRTAFLRYFLNELRIIESKTEKVKLISFKKIVVRPKQWKSYRRALKKKLLIILDHFRNRLNDKDKYRRLNYDISEKNIHWGLFLIVILYSVLFYILYFARHTFLSTISIFSVPLYTLISSNIKLISGIILSISITSLIPIIGQIITTQRSSRGISTVDQFDNLLDQVLKNVKKEKIIVFVDDLDRVTPKIARDVLDNLRTFFDKKELSFVVTGDHTVLERYIGSQILPTGNEGEYSEEGRRYLKKIFNYYWRLPIPIDKEFNIEIERKFTEIEKLSNIFSQEQQTILKSYFAKYFDKNFRQINRFLDSILFTFKIIDLQLKNSEEDSKKYFEQLKEHPLLVVRILMIQDLCTPLFEEILKDYNILFDLEQAARKGDNEKIGTIMTEYGKDLSIARKGFIVQFLKEEPKFHGETGLTVSDIRPFLFLAADASFGDSRGPSPDEFTTSMQTNDPEEIKKVLMGSGEPRIKDASHAALTLLTETDDENQRNHYLKSLVIALANISPDHILQEIFLNKLIDFDYNKILAWGSQKEKMELIYAIWRWLDLQISQEIVIKYKDKFPFTNIEDFDMFDFPEGPRIFSSRVMTYRLNQYYSVDKVGAIDKMLDIFPKLNIEQVSEELTHIENTLITDVLTNEGENLREKRLDLILKHTKDGKSLLKKAVLAGIRSSNEELWQWAITKADEPDYWTRKELEQEIYSNLDGLPDTAHLFEIIRFGSSKFSVIKDGFWERVIHEHSDDFKILAPMMCNESFGASFAPSKSIGNRIFSTIVQTAQASEDSVKIQLLNCLKKGIWIWANNQEIPDGKNLAKLLRTESDGLVRQTIKEVLDSWDYPFDTEQDDL